MIEYTYVIKTNRLLSTTIVAAALEAFFLADDEDFEVEVKEATNELREI